MATTKLQFSRVSIWFANWRLVWRFRRFSQQSRGVNQRCT